MARIKLTKTELKAQTDALKRFQRFLPMLQLKKQQLQAEIAGVQARVGEVTAREQGIRKALDAWVGLFATIDTPALKGLVKVRRIDVGEANVAGVTIPVFHAIETDVKELDLWEAPPWMDDAVKTLTSVLSLQCERGVLEEQCELITQELTTTSQRVNLFEKVKIPACKENIRVIKIALGDEQTAAVTRGKIAKGRAA